MTYVFTSAAWNYLPKAQILSKSVRKFIPGAKIVLALPDVLTDDVDIAKYDFDEVLPVNSDLCQIDNLNAWVFSHDIVELATAIKPFALCKLLERPDCERVLYFDPDIEIFSPLDDLIAEFDKASILLTPHITGPEEKEENVINYELCPLQFGVFNFGFVGVKNSDVGRRYAKWWRARCTRFCYDDRPVGIFTDQKWNDLVPGIFPEVAILRSPRYNVAAWNATLRAITKDAKTGQWLVDGMPLGFYHFTGIDSGAHHRMVRQFSCSPIAQIEFVKAYEEKMHAAAQDPLCQRPWAFTNYTSGEKIAKPARVYVREDGNMAKLFKNPFDTEEKPRAFRSWYQENIEGPANQKAQALASLESIKGGLEEQVSQLKAICENLTAENLDMKNSKSWRLTSPLRFVMGHVRESKPYMLAKKVKHNLAEYGIKWTLRKIYTYVARKRPKDIQENAVCQGTEESLSIDDRLLSRIFEKPSAKVDSKATATVVVPVYNGLDHLKRLVPGLLANTPASFPILFINDASPDCAVAKFLERLAKENPDRVSVVANKQNLGFVKTVNKAMKMTSGHVILLNSDTDVPTGWAERMMRCLTQKTASVTPFSNAASIASFPALGTNNRWLMDNFKADDVDKAFHGLVLRPDLRILPVGVGFCMLMNRAAIDAVGLFDEKSFGKGYCEEADWCVRAFDAGFENVLASDLFVMHFDGGSFTTEQKTTEAFEHEKIFAMKHPDFHGRHYLSHLSKREPYLEILRDVAILRFLTDKRFHPLLVIANGLVGGSAAYLKKYEGMKDRAVLYARPANGNIVLTLQYGDFTMKIKASSLEFLRKQDIIRSVDEIMVNHFLGWETYFGALPRYSPDVYRKAVNMVISLKKYYKARLSFAFHDFFAICPCYVLLDATGRFCDPDDSCAKCQGCLPSISASAGVDSLSALRGWRTTAAKFFAACDELRFFSQNTCDIVHKAIDFDLRKASIVPHTPLADFKPLEISGDGPLTIGIVGGINRCKGADFLEGFANYLAKADPSARIIIIGAVDHPPYPANVTVHGPYEHAQLPELITRYGVNVGFISAIWPETFSYVTQELMMLNLPLASFDIGAPVERISKYPRGAIIPEITPEAAYATIARLKKEVYSKL